MLLLHIATLLCLLFIFYQDMKYRAVYWICFPILAGLLIAMKWIQMGDIMSILTEAAYCFFFIAIQLALLWIYFSVKHKEATNITKDYLGWGDVLFLLTIIFYLSPGNYVLFYIVSLILVLVYVVIINAVSNQVSKHIPLAGLQAVLLAFAMIADKFLTNFTLYSDNWLYLLYFRGIN